MASYDGKVLKFNIKDLPKIFDFARRSWSWDLEELYPKYELLWRLLSLAWLIGIFYLLFAFAFRLRDAIIAGDNYYMNAYNVLTGGGITSIPIINSMVQPDQRDEKKDVDISDSIIFDRLLKDDGEFQEWESASMHDIADSEEKEKERYYKSALKIFMEKTEYYFTMIMGYLNFAFLPVKKRIIANIIKDICFLGLWIWLNAAVFNYTIGGSVSVSVGSGLQNITRIIPLKNFSF